MHTQCTSNEIQCKAMHIQSSSCAARASALLSAGSSASSVSFAATAEASASSLAASTLAVSSNVTRICRALLPKSDDGMQQIVYYQGGLGSQDSFWSYLFGGYLGAGISENVREAYAFLCNVRFNFLPFLEERSKLRRDRTTTKATKSSS